MIPKIAHFHWEGRPLNWLRMMGLYSFIRLNPRWEVRLIRTAEHIREKRLPMHAHGADWSWAEALLEFGGFNCGTDTIFIKPIPDEWLEGDMCACTNGLRDGFFHGMIGSVPGTEYLKRYVNRCRTFGRPDDYQTFGTHMMSTIIGSMGGISGLRKKMKFFDMSANAITPIRWNTPERCWSDEPFDFPEETVAVTWYGGAPCSKEREWEVPWKHSDSAIVQLALGMTRDEVHEPSTV